MPIQNRFSLSRNKATMIYGEPPEQYSVQVSARAVLESPTGTAMESVISDILRLRPDDQQSVRSNQVLCHCTLNYPHYVVLKLSHLAGTCSDPQITAASISFLSTLLTKSGYQIMPKILTDLKTPLLSCLQNTAGPIYRRFVPVLINVSSRIFEASGEEWTEFLDYVVLSSLGKDQNLETQEPALTVLSIFPAELLHQLKRFELGAVWSTILLQADSMKDEVLQEVLFAMISAIIETMNHGKKDVAGSLVSSMGLMTTEVHSYAPKLFSDRRFDYVSEVMVAIVYKDGEVAGGVKREAVRVLVKLGELNREQMLGVVQKWGSDDVAVVVATLMETLEDVIVASSRVMSETFKLGYNSLNSMSSYCGEIMFDIVSDMVKVNIEADEWRKRYAGVYAISADVNSINEVVNKYLEQFVQILSNVSADVRWAASSTIRRFSTQFIQYHERILPALTTSLVDFDSDSLVDFDSDVLKGTTNFGLIYNGGVLFGADSRISNTAYNYIARDDYIKVRRIRGNFQGTIYCTLAGSVNPWSELYKHLNNEIIVTSIEDALDKANVFLHQYMRNRRKKLEYMKNVLKTEEVFGMLIGGYTQTEGYRLGVVYLQHTTVYMSIRDSAETLGSGAEFANEILKISTSVERQAYGEEKIMTRQQAVGLGFQTLCYAKTRDKYSGGSSHVVHINEHDAEVKTSTSLNLYATYYGDINKRSLFLLYVWSYPIWTDEDMEELLRTIWPNGEVTCDDLEAHHFLAKRLDIHIHRFLFKDEQTATEAYTQVNQVADPPDRGPHDTLEDQFVVRGFVRRCGTRQDPVYVGPSSFQFLTHMCHMPEPSSLEYPRPP